MHHLVRTVVSMACVLLGGPIGSLSAAAAQTPSMSAQPAAVPGILPTEFGESVDRDIAKVREATARFAVDAEAIAAGYEATTRCIQHPQEGAMGFHYRKEALRDGTLEVEHPEFVMYERMPDGRMKMTGVEYVVPIPTWTRSDPPTIMTRPLIRDDKLGIFYLHAWIWEPNPSGLFANWNPRVKCPDASQSHD
jgi:hypothetical protein